MMLVKKERMNVHDEDLMIYRACMILVDNIKAVPVCSQQIQAGPGRCCACAECPHNVRFIPAFVLRLNVALQVEGQNGWRSACY